MGFIINGKKIPFFSPLSLLFGRFFSSFPSSTTNTVTEPVVNKICRNRNLPFHVILRESRSTHKYAELRSLSTKPPCHVQIVSPALYLTASPKALYLISKAHISPL